MPESNMAPLTAGFSPTPSSDALVPAGFAARFDRLTARYLRTLRQVRRASATLDSDRDHPGHLRRAGEATIDRATARFIDAEDAVSAMIRSITAGRLIAFPELSAERVAPSGFAAVEFAGRIWSLDATGQNVMVRPVVLLVRLG